MSEESTPEAKTPRKAASTATKPAAKRKTAASKPATTKKTSSSKTATAKTTSTRKVSPAKKTTAKKTTTRKTSTSKTGTAAKKTTARASTAKTTADKETPKVEEIKVEETVSEKPDNADTFVEDLKDKDWGASLKRGIFMLIFGFVGQFALSVTFFLAFLQFIVSLLVGPPNTAITAAIGTASRYLSEILAYLSFKTDDLPFPFGNDFPSGEDD
ncbi:MAG: DUF4389 domain-containing protein [Kordiimonas sp.]